MTEPTAGRLEAPDLPAHIEETAAQIAELYTARYREAVAAQRFVTFATATFARPRTLAVLAVAITAWLWPHFLRAGQSRMTSGAFPRA
jgi:hypothetical protein